MGLGFIGDEKEKGFRDTLGCLGGARWQRKARRSMYCTMLSRLFDHGIVIDFHVTFINY